MKNSACQKSDLVVSVKAQLASRFKAGSDLSSKVNFVGVDWSEEMSEDQELIEVKLTISSERCIAENEVEA